jgi:hypothetical protein
MHVCVISNTSAPQVWSRDSKLRESFIHTHTQYTKLTFPLKVNVYPPFYRDGTIRNTM